MKRFSLTTRWSTSRETIYLPIQTDEFFDFDARADFCGGGAMYLECVLLG